MHILVVSQCFYPENFRINDICEEWIKRGHKVTVVTSVPNYPEGRFYPGYSWFKKRKENYKGIDIIRLPIIPRGHNSIGLVLNYISFVTAGWWWKCFTKIKADLVFNFETSPMTQALVAVWYAKRRKIPCNIYVQDLWPENVEMITGIKSPLIIKPIDKMVDYIYKNCKHILVTSPSFQKHLENRKNVWEKSKSKLYYWPQYAEDFYRPIKCDNKQESRDKEVFTIAFTGNVGYAQGLQILPKVAKIIKEKKSERYSYLFMIVGDGRYMDQLRKEIKENNVEKMFCLLGKKNPREIPAILSSVDAAFLSFAKNEIFKKTIPAKMQSYMACGKAIIACAEGETKRIINEAKCGICCSLENEYELADVLEKIDKSMLEKMANNSYKYFCLHFSKKRLMDEIEEVLELS